ncbi:hypothetical protein Tsubulata_121760 [Turnera subulata]|uniref:Peptide N-acetyl-beta-D-glucosaminyl asparaginase amidase A N-terminal domain-containing protein n=1 Tax=Turnera subulata TaxID=218843 RepID=A0A9Q0FAG8_9ROSI|nr:hypothetical protein Tsubulata_121760 [Turnera subulata]
MNPFLTLLLLYAITTITVSSSPHSTSTSPDHFFKPTLSSSLSSSPSPSPSPSEEPQEYLEVTRPLPSDRLTPCSTLSVIHHSFGNTINKPPFSTPYYPPLDCPPPWSHVTLQFSARSKGDQYDRISGLWLGGSELLRTSTAEPTQDGIFWNVRKDITRYSSLLVQNHLNFTLMLENIVNSVYTAVYHVDVTLFFYKDHAVTPPLTPKKSDQIIQLANYNVDHYQSPADLIIPVSSMEDSSRGYWFIIEKESDIHYKKVRFPMNTRKLVLELYASFHGNDEFWYSNPPNSYIRMNNLTTRRGNGAFREVFVTIDNQFVGSEVPFPVVFTGGINPLFWEPVVGIGAFDLPTYDIDLTPFLGMVLDGEDHVVGVGVSDGISYWLVDANLHVWLDTKSESVEARSVVRYTPGSVINRKEAFKLLDGSFSIRAQRVSRLDGWVKSSGGNLTTSVMQVFRYRNLIRFSKNGTYKYVTQNIRTKRQVKVMDSLGVLVSQVVVRRKYPLKVVTATLPGSEEDRYVLVTNVTRSVNDRYRDGRVSRSVHNKQVSNGWMEVKDHDVLNGTAMTNQTYSCKDEFGCYVRIVAALDGRLIADNSSLSCPSVM